MIATWSVSHKSICSSTRCEKTANTLAVHSGTGFVQALWVREDLRQRGLGSQLLQAAEDEARRRGCREMHLDTHSYQSPGFYRRLGYEAIGELPGWPANTTRIFFRKAL